MYKFTERWQIHSKATRVEGQPPLPCISTDALLGQMFKIEA
jgi:hypothetical protein